MYINKGGEGVKVFWIHLPKYTVSAMKGTIFLDMQVKYTVKAMKGGNIFDTVIGNILLMI